MGRQRGAGDDTGLDLPDSTEAPGHSHPGDSQPGHSQPRSADDDTGLDLPDATRTNIQQEVPTHGEGDETGLDFPDATRTNIQQEVPTRGEGEETGLDLPDATRTNIQQDVPTHGVADETGLDIPDATRTNIQQQVPTHGEGEETGLDIPDTTGTNIQQDVATHGEGEETDLDIPKTEDEAYSGEEDLSGHRQTGDDETDVFVAASAEDMVIDSGPVVRDRSTTEDETDLSQLAAAEGLTADREQPVDSAAAGDETDSGQSQQVSDTADDNVAASDSDATDLSQPIQDQAVGEAEKESGDEDGDGDETDFNQPSLWADQIKRAQAQHSPPDDLQDDLEDEQDSVPDRDAMDDEDLSLMLIEREETKPELTAATSFTEPQVPQARDLALEDIAPGTEELSLTDNTQNKVPEEQTDTQTPTLTSPTATGLYAGETRTNLNSPTVTRDDSTSTRTYAPDNYDRTLMKVANDDASNIFSGMKSDSDVVMTPDYAKKVFSSKTSIQRARHYRVYSGIAIVLALSIIIFGVFEYQDQSELIDSSLRSLKRDPMPGAIKTAQPEKADLFIEPDAKVDARTLEIIESANQAGSIPVVGDTVSQAEIENMVSQAEIKDTVSQVEIIEAAPAPQFEIATAEAEPTMSDPRIEPVQPKQPPVPRDDTDQVASLTSSAPGPAQTDAKHNLHITSSSQYPQTGIWLREAYAAYRIGDNQRALSLYNQVLEVDPANRNALLARAAIHMQDGAIDAAIRDYQALLLANPKDSLAMSSLLAVSTYSPRETESQLKLMIREEPDSPYLNFALANAYGAQKRWQEAQRHYFKALQHNPSDPNYAYNLAVSLEHISQPSSAITYYQRALDNFTNGLATFNRDVVNQRLELLGNL
jgi:tetratricopeptide (TPR) repeat protein